MAQTWPARLLNLDPAEQLFPALLALTRGWVSSVHGIALESAGLCKTLRLSEGLTVDFWPVDPDHPDQVLGSEAVSLEMMRSETSMTANQRMRCLSLMASEDRKAS